MKNIILIILLIFNSCNAQNINNDTVKYYNAEQYKDWEKDSEYLSSYSNDDMFLMKGNRRVRIWIDEIIHIEKSNKVNPYTYFYAYDPKDNLLIGYYSNFYNTICGLDRDYDKTGKIIKEQNWDIPYKFTIEDIVKKFKEEYKVDILKRKNVFRFYRYENSKSLGIPYYKIYLTTDIENKWVDYLIDGNTGKTLYIMKSSRGDDTDIFEEYLKSIGKFKGRAYKSDPATE